MFYFKIFCLLLFSGTFSEINGAKILGIYTFDIKSHYILAQTLFKQLANDGHEVTVITGFKTENLPVNYKEITMNLLNLDEFKKIVAKGSTIFGFISIFTSFREYSHNNTMTLITDKRVQALFNSNETFDVILLGSGQSPAIIGLSAVFKAPVIITSPTKLSVFLETYTGSFAHDSFVSNILLPFQDDMNYHQRLYNTMMNWFFRFMMIFMMHDQELLYHELFPDLKENFHEVLKSSVKMCLVNSHFSINKPMPYMTNMIEVAGIQIPDAVEPLPKKLQEFLDTATDDVIYFCMGGTLKTKDFESDKKSILLNTLKKIKQKVILKWDNPESIDVDPKKIYVSKWMPQNDILASRKIKLYITHGGLLSTTEAIYHAVPILGIPVFGDQRMNMAKYKSLGFAIELPFSTITEENLEMAINEMLTNRTYHENVSKLSQRFRDRPMTGLQTAKYWVEYVIRHKNEDYFLSPARNLNGIQYFNLDVYATILLIVFIIFYATVKLLKFFVKKLFCKSNKKIKTS